MDKNKLKKYIVQVEGLELKGSGVLFCYYDEVYIFTAKHNLAYKEKQKVHKIDIKELIKQKNNIKIYPHIKLKIDDVIELEKSLDILILKIDKDSIEGIEISDLSIFEDELNDSLPYTIVGYPKIRNDKSLEFFDCKYEVSDNSIFEVHSDKVSDLDEKQKKEELVGLSGGGAFIQYESQIYLLGIQIRYEGFSNLECINLQKLKDRIDDKLIKSNIETIEDEIKLDSDKSFKIKMVKVDLPDKSLYVSIYPVTFDEYDLFCENTKRCKEYEPNDRSWGRGKRPVINVNWNDAIAYCEWLNNYSNNKQQYSLPNSTDWLLVAEKNIPNFINTDIWYNKKKKTSPVDIGGKGQLGIYHMYGNVYEWCIDGIEDDKYIALGGSYRTSNIRKFLRVEEKQTLKAPTIGFRICSKVNL